jgi:hypothetical protein
MDEEYEPSKEEWKSILLLADMWKFDGIRKRAIKQLGDLPLEPVEKVELCRRFDIQDSWASKAFAALVVRKEPLSIDEEYRVGWENSLAIAHAREQRIRKELEKTQQKLKNQVHFNELEITKEEKRFGAVGEVIFVEEKGVKLDRASGKVIAQLRSAMKSLSRKS